MANSIVDSREILFRVTDPNYQGTVAENWNERILESIRTEKKEIEDRYNIRRG